MAPRGEREARAGLCRFGFCRDRRPRLSGRAERPRQRPCAVPRSECILIGATFVPTASTGGCISQLRRSQRGTWGYGWRPRLPKAEGKQLLQGAHIRVNSPYSRSTGAVGNCSPLPRILDASDVSIRAESVSVDGDGCILPAEALRRLSGERFTCLELGTGRLILRHARADRSRTSRTLRTASACDFELPRGRHDGRNQLQRRRREVSSWKPPSARNVRERRADGDGMYRVSITDIPAYLYGWQTANSTSEGGGTLLWRREQLQEDSGQRWKTALGRGQERRVAVRDSSSVSSSVRISADP